MLPTNTEAAPHPSGFTLIELAIVLVIIGLIIGGVLVGKSMIEQAGVTSSIAQIQKYKTEVAAFQLKYDNYLPGDVPDPAASNLGLLPAQGNGNGVVESGTLWTISGESLMFWADLSKAGMIDGDFSTAMPGGYYDTITAGTTPDIKALIPAGRVGNGNYVYVFQAGWNDAWTFTRVGVNYFGLSAVTEIYGGWGPISTPGLTVNQAYAIDVKIDDGLPQSGSVMAMYLMSSSHNYGPLWAGANSASPFSYAGVGTQWPNNIRNAITMTGSAATCFDGNNYWGSVMHYSVNQSGGSGVNCALSFRF